LLGLGGTLLLGPVAQRFRIDQVRCDAWPPWPERLALCLLYLLCVLLLFVGWQRLLRQAGVSGCLSAASAGNCWAVAWRAAAVAAVSVR
jgi:hypothetical protein